MRFLAFASVVLGSALGAQDEGLRERVDKALGRARPVLLDHLRRQQGGVLALVCLAAAHDGLTTENKRFRQAIHRLSRTRLIGTYDLALRLMVMFEVQDFPRRQWLTGKDTEHLLERRSGGGFTYAESRGSWDLSNTQYAALGLRAAAAMGESIDATVWSELAETVMAAQTENGGFGYSVHLQRRGAYSSMTVAGIGVLRICQEQLGPDAPEGIEDCVARAWKWMAAHQNDIGNLGTASCFYFHYGLERAAILCDVQTVGRRNWYESGADMLLGAQERSGAWSSPMEIRPGALSGEGSPVDTAFAMLFLRRQFKRSLTRRAPITGPRGFTSLGEDADDAEISHVAETMVAHGVSVLPDVLKALRSDVPTQRRAAAAVLRGLAGKDFGYDPAVDPAESAEAIKAAELWWLKEGRKGLDEDGGG